MVELKRAFKEARGGSLSFAEINVDFTDFAIHISSMGNKSRGAKEPA